MAMTENDGKMYVLLVARGHLGLCSNVDDDADDYDDEEKHDDKQST